MTGRELGTSPSRFRAAADLVEHLRKLRLQRLSRKQDRGLIPNKRKRLNAAARQMILDKTAGHCHLCGGHIDDDAWEAAHVLPHAGGGQTHERNLLAAHPVCNRMRWFYGPEEFQWILRLGVWLRTQLEEQEDPAATQVVQRFLEHRQRNRHPPRDKVARAEATGDSSPDPSGKPSDAP